MGIHQTRARDLVHSLPSICRALTRQKGIRLVLQGPPRTDGRTIYSNPLPLDATEDQISIITGDIDHECGHILYTDFAAVSTYTEDTPAERRMFAHGVENAIEDTFMERRLGNAYLGCRENLRRSAELFVPDIQVADAEATPGPAIIQYIDAWGRTHVLANNLGDIPRKCGDNVTHLLGDKTKAALDALLEQNMAAVDSTTAGIALAQRVVDLLASVGNQKQDQKQKQKSGGGNEANGSGQGPHANGTSGNAVSNGAPNPDGAPEGDTDTSASGQGDQTATGDNATGGSPGDGESSPEPFRLNAASALADQTVAAPLVDRRAATEAACEQAAKHSTVIDESMCAATGAGDSNPPVQMDEDLERYRMLRDSVSAEIHSLSRRVVNEYQTATRRRRIITEDGRIDAHRLVRASLGDPFIHSARVKRDTPYPAVSLLLDTSGSMAGPKLDLAVSSLIATLEANRQIGVATSVTAFSGWCRTVKPFSTDLNPRVMGRIGGLYATGGTLLATALWQCGNAIAVRREARRIIVVITDGVPNDPDACKRIARMIGASHIELYGIGIDSDAVRDYCPCSHVVTHANEIAGAVVSALRERLLRAA